LDRQDLQLGHPVIDGLRKCTAALQPSEARELKQLRDEVTKLKRLVADLSLDKVML
jgi:putative transposase